MYKPRPIADRQLWDLPQEVQFCTRCVMSNQRPRIKFDEEGVCSACRYAEKKAQKTIDFDERKLRVEQLMDHHRSKDGAYDVVVPCSGGKDSSMIAHRLKHEYGMHPLSVTFSPPVYSEIGWRNLRRFIDAGFDHILITPSGTLHRPLTKLGMTILGDHNEIFDRGQMSGPIRIAYQYGIRLVMYGENGEIEYGGDPRLEDCPGMPWSDYERIYYSMELDELVQIGVEDGYFTEPIEERSLDVYRLPPIKEIQEMGLEFHWFAFYHPWVPQEHYYYAAKHTGFEANPEGRTEGTYSKYAQLDDLTDSFLYYMMFIKFGFGRATSDAAHEVRDGHIEMEEAVALVRRYDGEFPDRHFAEFLDYVDLTEGEFWDVVDRFRLPHIWKKENGEWVLRHQVS